MYSSSIIFAFFIYFKVCPFSLCGCLELLESLLKGAMLLKGQVHG